MIYINCCTVVSVVVSSYLFQNVRSAPKINIESSKRIYSKTIKGVYLNDSRLNDAKACDNDVKNLLRSRFKRQVSAGAGKFADAAKMPQIKTFRLFLQLFKNLWTDAPIGGAGPFDPEVVKPFLYLFKDKIIAFFFPDPREEHKKKSH